MRSWGGPSSTREGEGRGGFTGLAGATSIEAVATQNSEGRRHGPGVVCNGDGGATTASLGVAVGRYAGVRASRRWPGGVNRWLGGWRAGVGVVNQAHERCFRRRSFGNNDAPSQ